MMSRSIKVQQKYIYNGNSIVLKYHLCRNKNQQHMISR